QPGPIVASGATVIANVTIQNSGTIPSPGPLIVGMSPPPGLELVQPIPAQQPPDMSCTARGPGPRASVDCGLPPLNDGQSRVVSFALRGILTPVAITSCLTATAEVRPLDPNPANNAASGCLTVTPSNPDLSVRMERSAGLALNQQTSYT